MRAAAQSYVDSRVSLLCGTLAWSAHPLHGEPEEGTAAQSSTADLGKPRDTGSSTHCTCHRCLGTGTCAAGRNHARAFPARAKSYRARCRPYVGRRHGFSRSDTSDPGAAGCARARSIKRTATEGDLETMTSCTMSLRPTLPGRPSGSARRIDQDTTLHRIVPDTGDWLWLAKLPGASGLRAQCIYGRANSRRLALRSNARDRSRLMPRV
jgi:hypothetical protein